MKKILIIFAAVFGLSNAQATLTLTDGGQMLYDSVSNISWTTNANMFGSMLAADPKLVNQVIAYTPNVAMPANGYATNGEYALTASDFNGFKLDMPAAAAWINYLNHINWMGANTWALPTATATSSQLFTFYTELGGPANGPSITSLAASYPTGPAGSLTNISSTIYAYWTSSLYQSNLTDAYFTEMNESGGTGNGVQGSYAPFVANSVWGGWAVLPGAAVTVTANYASITPPTVPLPGTLWLVAIATIMLLFVRVLAQVLYQMGSNQVGHRQGKSFPGRDEQSVFWAKGVLVRNAFAGKQLVFIMKRLGLEPPVLLEVEGSAADLAAPKIK